MSETKYYCLCDDDCRFETMTKEQILAAIEHALANGSVENFSGGFVTKVQEKNKGGYVTFWVGTQAEYNALESTDGNCMYIVSDSTWQADLEALYSRILQTLENHLADQNNPHKVTAEQVGAASAKDVKTLSDSMASHQQDKNNPHGVTIDQIGAAPAYSYGTEDLEAGVTRLEKGKLHFVYVKG